MKDLNDTTSKEVIKGHENKEKVLERLNCKVKSTPRKTYIMIGGIPHSVLTGKPLTKLSK